MSVRARYNSCEQCETSPELLREECLKKTKDDGLVTGRKNHVIRQGYECGTSGEA